jgi:hypothetical protein
MLSLSLARRQEEQTKGTDFDEAALHFEADGACGGDNVVGGVTSERDRGAGRIFCGPCPALCQRVRPFPAR